MRIISGVYKGMDLTTPRGERTRPTAVKVRGAVMSMMQSYLEGAQFLDLFAGSGAVGIEAISRGATTCTFIERDREAIAALSANIKEAQRRSGAQSLPIPKMRVIAADVLATLRDPQRAALAPAFDIVWCDPPYDQVADILPAVVGALVRLTRPGSFLLVESDDALSMEAGTTQTCQGAIWTLQKNKSYGETQVWIFERST